MLQQDVYELHVSLTLDCHADSTLGLSLAGDLPGIHYRPADTGYVWMLMELTSPYLAKDEIEGKGTPCEVCRLKHPEVWQWIRVIITETGPDPLVLLQKAERHVCSARSIDSICIHSFLSDGGRTGFGFYYGDRPNVSLEEIVMKKNK